MQDFPCEFEQMVSKCNILPSTFYKYLSKGQTVTAQGACLSIYINRPILISQFRPLPFITNLRIDLLERKEDHELHESTH